MTTVAPPLLSTRVSRRELATNRIVWLATGGMFGFFAIMGTFSTIVFPDAFVADRALPCAILLAFVSAILLRSEPPQLGTWQNHATVTAAYLAAATGMWAFEPGGGLAVGALFFAGPLIAVRVQDRRHILVHLVAFSIVFSGLAFSGAVALRSSLLLLLLIPCVFVLCVSCVIALEAAEEQGDELERLVRRDPLTGVGNRRLLDETLVDEISRHRRIGRPLSLVAIDLDGFKQLNDSAGHAAGDEVLREVADALVRAVNQRDTVVRQGGDEFCVVVPETGSKQVMRTAHAIHAELSTIRLPTDRPITTGMGIATFPDDALQAEVLLHVADERLIAAKEESRAARELLGDDDDDADQR